MRLLTEFASEKKFSEMAEAFTRFRSVYGANAGFVEEAVPGKILNWFFVKGGAIDFSTFETWTKSSERKDWAAQIKQAIASPSTFEMLVKAMREELVAIERKRAEAK